MKRNGRKREPKSIPTFSFSPKISSFPPKLDGFGGREIPKYTLLRFFTKVYLNLSSVKDKIRVKKINSFSFLNSPNTAQINKNLSFRRHLEEKP